MPPPTPIAPPIFMQVPVPSIMTKPAPYCAQALAEAGRLTGSDLLDGAAV